MLAAFTTASASMPARLPICLPPRPGERRQRRISLPMVTALCDEERCSPETKYTQRDPARPPRCPSLRQLVRLARRAATAEEFGLLLRQRFERNAGGVQPRDLEDDLLDAQLDELELLLLAE
jgi:hypothetical protein